MENKNLALYEKYSKPPKEALKDFDNGSFKGTDINSMWRIKALTEEFGVCGIGWYTDLVRQWSEPAPNDEVLCFVEIKMYVKVNGEWSMGFSAIGGSKIIQYFKTKAYAKGNDEGYKMAYTDALGVACKFLGFGASIYWAEDKSKYSQEEVVKTATAEQLAKIRELVSDIPAMLAYYKLGDLNEMTEKQAQDLIAKKTKR